jgi:DNA-binding transcriptional LysR family regulator
MELDIRRLRVLREVALRGTIVAAADSLGFTPSAISQQLTALERESGSVLLERTGRGVRLTDAGHVLVSRTEPVLVALEEAKAALEESRTTVGGDIRLAASGSLARAFVVPTVASVADAYPQLKITLLEYESGDSLRELKLGELDIVVTHEYDHERRPPEPELVRVDLFAEDMLIAAPAGRFDAPVALADLKEEIWAADPPTNSCGRAVRSACRAVGFEPDVRYNSNEYGVLLSAVVHAGAVALMPRLGLDGVPPGVDVLPVADLPTRRLVFAARRRGTPPRPGVTTVIEQLQAAARDRTRTR